MIHVSPGWWLSGASVLLVMICCFSGAVCPFCGVALFAGHIVFFLYFALVSGGWWPSGLCVCFLHCVHGTLVFLCLSVSLLVMISLSGVCVGGGSCICLWGCGSLDVLRLFSLLGIFCAVCICLWGWRPPGLSPLFVS